MIEGRSLTYPNYWPRILYILDFSFDLDQPGSVFMDYSFVSLFVREGEGRRTESIWKARKLTLLKNKQGK